ADVGDRPHLLERVHAVVLGALALHGEGLELVADGHRVALLHGHGDVGGHVGHARWATAEHDEQGQPDGWWHRRRHITVAAAGAGRRAEPVTTTPGPRPGDRCGRIDLRLTASQWSYAACWAANASASSRRGALSRAASHVGRPS